MSSWAGFTDEELSHLRQNTREDDLVEGKGLGSRKKAAINTAKRQRPREKIRTRASPGKQEGADGQGQRDRAQSGQRKTAATANSGGRSSSRLDSREEEKENSSPECERRGKNSKHTKEDNTMPEEAPPKRKPIKKTDDPHHENALQLSDKFSVQGGSGSCNTEKELESNLPEIIDENDRIQAIELSALEKMQEKQKQIEQENKRKKAALQETIKKRYKKTQAEAHTLSLVQQELSHLDSLLSTDVAILRDKIEESSREYLNARKRYEKAEKEYVEAKMDLHRKTERKDLLTEHLYTIIRENELRKAKKLEELMAKLNISTEEALSMQQTAFLEVSGDETSIKQNNTEISMSQEEKASSQTHESSSEPNDSQVDTVEDTTAITKETKVNLTTETEPVCSENEATVTS